MKNTYTLIKLTLCLIVLGPIQAHSDRFSDSGHSYCTVTDNIYFSVVTNLIGSIHKNDYEKLNTIIVCDIGMSADQKEFLSTLEKVVVLPIEQVNPDIITYFWVHPNGKTARGWYTWKPVALKQALDQLPYFLFVDAGTTILKPMDIVFDHIREHGYFFMGAGHSIYTNITRRVIDHFLKIFSKEQVRAFLNPNTPSISAGLIGISRDLEDTLIQPTYELASNINLFEDDGSAVLGFGAARPEQILFSIFINVHGYHVYPNHCKEINLHGEQIPFYVTCCCTRNAFGGAQHVYQSRWDTTGNYTQYLRFKINEDHSAQDIASLEHRPGGLVKNQDAYENFVKNKKNKS